MAQKTKNGNIEITEGKDILIREILRMLPYTTVTLLGPAGTGKTTIVEEIAEKANYIDELVILRLQGLGSEDFRMPMLVDDNKAQIKLDENKQETGKFSFVNFKMPTPKKTVEFAKMGVLKEICDNPDKKYLVFFDEILRCNLDVAPLLFELLERKIDGIFRPNMFVMTAANYNGSGESYIQNIDYEDPALRRRQIFIEWKPNKNDIEEYISAHDYHKIIQEVIEALPYDNIIDHSTSRPLEQTTQLGSWALLNNRWNFMEQQEHILLDYRTAKEDIAIFGAYMLNDTTSRAVLDKLTLFEQINTIDIQKEIIENEGLITPGYVMYDKKGKVYDYENRKTELRIRAKYFVREQILKDFKYLEKYGEKIVKLFEGKPEMFVSFFDDMNRAYEREAKKKCDDKMKAGEMADSNKSKLAKTINEILRSSKDKRVQEIRKQFMEGISILNSGTFNR